MAKKRTSRIGGRDGTALLYLFKYSLAIPSTPNSSRSTARKHALGYLQDFLFSHERARAPITALSGGECNRLLLAKLFTKPSNLLLMDEPTNDLDVETQELLEELLASYTGTLLLVSHDRESLDNVVTSTLALDGNGRVEEYVGGYSDWLRQSAAAAAARRPDRTTAPAASPPPAPSAKRKLNYKDARELEALPQKIETLETRIAGLGAKMQEPTFYQQDGAAIVALNSELAVLQVELDAAYAKWQELDVQ